MIGYRLRLAWARYIGGVRERYRLLMTPAHRGFFLPWLSYLVFVAVAFRWETDLLLLGVIALHACHTPALPRLEREAVVLPLVMTLAIVVMMVSLIPVQKGYARAVPVWIGEALLTLLPLSAVMTLIGLAFYWTDLKYACG